MWILDFFQKKETKNELLTVHWVVGTDIQQGILSEEYNSDLQFPDCIWVFDEMRKSDWTIIAILRAIKQPLLSAKWQINSWWEEKIDKEVADFINHNLFEKIKFKHFLRESLGFLDFGFYYFEKNFEIVNWKVEWKELAPRVPKAHYLWNLQKSKEWIDWHPAGITQLINLSDESVESNNMREIPWNKLILFSYEKEGNNFEGVSILRNAYKHYFYKDLLYKIQSISAERYWSWIPSAQVKTWTSKQNQTKIEEALKNIRANEQGYIVYTDDVVKMEILTPNGTGVDMNPMIEHHDRKIYDSILAWFLNLTSGDWWSNALSKDQSSFFLRWLQWIADMFIDTMNEHIKELVDLNYNWIKNYPKLTVSDIGSISMDEQVTSIWNALEKWLIDFTQDDKNVVRDILKLPRLTQAHIKQIEEENKNKKEEIKEEKNEEDGKMSEFSENKKKIVPTNREKAFTKNITDFEEFLNNKYKDVEDYIVDLEKDYTEELQELYENSETQRVDWVVCLVFDKTKINKWKKIVEKYSQKMTDFLIDWEIQKEIFNESIKMAKQTISDNDKNLSERVEIKASQINTFIEWYKSNMQGVIYNENRRVLENITLNYWSEASLDLAKKSAEVSVNKNILWLSFIPHPRATYKYIIYNEAQKEWFTLFKTLVPISKLPNVIDRPFWVTASFIFTIQTAAQINKTASIATSWTTAEAVTWLWLHHWSFEYYYPISSDQLDIEEEIAKQQRDEFKNKIDEQK